MIEYKERLGYARLDEHDLMDRLRDIRHLALDMDGTLYLGSTLFEYTAPFLQLLRDMEIGYTFFTNNSSKSDRQYVAKLKEMGIEAQRDQIYSSTHATIDFLRGDPNNYRRIFVLGTQGQKDQMTEAEFDVCDTEPEMVVVGFDTDLVYDRLAQAAYWIEQGKPYIATHPDLICPTDQELVLPDCGAICKLLEAATGRTPDEILGKPNPAMLNGLRQRFELESAQIAMVGDRLYTDVAMANHAGMLGVLVLSGETQLEQLGEADEQADVVVEHVAELGALLSRARGQTGDFS
jgi:HAD superfamily hydrolase (TIGR01450 family)